jgi:hypothetical protein
MNDAPHEPPADEPPPAEAHGPEQPPPEEPPVEPRGILWIIVPAVVGLAVGGLIGTMQGMTRLTGPGRPQDESVLEYSLGGAIVGAIAGAIAGVLIWVCFPYQRLPLPEGEDQYPGDEDRSRQEPQV